MIEFSTIFGLAVGIEHHTGDEDDEFNWVIIVSLGFIRIGIFA